MTSHITSILRRKTSMKRPTLSGLKETIRANIDSDVSYVSNEYIHKNFYDDENYQSIIECLDGGYDVSTDLIDYMQDYCKLLQDQVDSLNSFSKKWKSKLDHQSSLSSYNTTKRAQLQTVSSSEKLAQLTQSRCDAVQQVITTYKQKVKSMYTAERLGTTHKHYRTDVIKKSFENARSSLSKISDKLDKLRKDEKKAQAALLQAQIQCQNLSLTETSSQDKLASANRYQKKQEDKLKDITDEINTADADYKQEQENYRKKATEIYEECRKLEEERLNQIRDTLIKFAQARHSSEYSEGQDTIYDNLLMEIKSEQDTQRDLDFWAQTYHVNISTESISSETNENNNLQSQKTKKSQKDETVNLTTIEENINQSIVETEEDQSAADKTTTSVKTKSLLIGGYSLGMNIIKSMKTYHNYWFSHVSWLISYSKKFIAQLKNQSSLSAYSTTMRVTINTFQTFQEQANLLQEFCDNNQRVIDKYRRQIDEMYPRERFSTSRKHYRSDEMKRSFQRARLPFNHMLLRLDKLRSDKQKTLAALHNATHEFEQLDPTTNKNKKKLAREKIDEQKNELENIQEAILDAEGKRDKKKAIYIEKATVIFKECQELEKERLDQIKQTLLDFNQAVYSSRYLTDLLQSVRT